MWGNEFRDNYTISDVINISIEVGIRQYGLLKWVGIQHESFRTKCMMCSTYISTQPHTFYMRIRGSLQKIFLCTRFGNKLVVVYKNFSVFMIVVMR